eukprot:m.433960 g.433960  ORF g.433960 m.433960 type:complete len:52 (-) comp95705_c0_seq1:16-171(-)
MRSSFDTRQLQAAPPSAFAPNSRKGERKARTVATKVTPHTQTDTDTLTHLH